MISLQGVTKVYQMGRRELEVLRGISVDIERGEMVAIMGPSGSGKTTMLNIIGCLDQPTAGSHFLDDSEVGRLSGGELAQVRAQKVGFVFQTFNLLPQLTALANVELGLRYARGANHSREAALAALTTVGLADRATHRPTELSGGEQQRVAIARALAKSPPLILADEPTGNLDSRSGAEVMSILTTLHSEQAITLVIITHDANIADHCQRTIRVMDGQVVEEERR
jgi:putative ABC transport system ATP-binding protein